MSKQDLLEFKGKVIDLLPNAMFRVKLENNHFIVAVRFGEEKRLGISKFKQQKQKLRIHKKSAKQLKKCAKRNSKARCKRYR